MGVIIADAYELGSELGAGAFGVVRECRRKGSDSVVACKSIDKKNLSSPAQMESLRSEVLSLHLLGQHPSVTSILGLHEDPTHVHILMEKCSGGDLFQYLQDHWPMDERQVADVFFQTCVAVNHCHSHGILHRDIKPENVLLVEQAPTLGQMPRLLPSGKMGYLPVVKLADFGLACTTVQAAEAAAATVVAMGTPLQHNEPCSTDIRKGTSFDSPARSCDSTCTSGIPSVQPVWGSVYYTAPEVFAFGTYSYAADVWALGVLLCLLLSGDFPFEGTTGEELLHSMGSTLQGGTQPLCLPRERWQGRSQSSQQLLSSMLQLDPTKRSTLDQVLRSSWVQQYFPNAQELVPLTKLEEWKLADRSESLRHEGYRNYPSKRPH